MSQRYGWAGKILRVDLGEGSISEVSTYDYTSLFIGGRGIASRMYWEEMGGNTGAFDPDNHLYFMNGPLSGTQAPAASRWLVLGKSPMCVPEQYAFGNFGGRLGAAMKWAGLDGLDITGASKKPVVIVIGPGGRCSLEDASGLWGKDAFETIESLQSTFGNKACVATIGRAGEMRVRFAAVIGSGGVSATKGFGAVMGSKNLKALVVVADPATLPVARPDAFQEVRQEVAEIHQGEGSGRLGQDLMLDDIEKVRGAYCYSCPGVCGRGQYHKSK
jgi:aldehyde:ferredoxin oxidoreductase